MKNHRRRLCRDQEYSRLRALNRAKLMLPARDSSRNAYSLPSVRGKNGREYARHYSSSWSRKTSSASNRNESSRESGEERARRPSISISRIRESPNSSISSTAEELESILGQERSWDVNDEELWRNRLDHSETLCEEACALKRGRLQGQVQVHRNHHALTHFCSLSPSLPFFGSFSERSWPEIDLASGERLTILYRQFAMQERR